MDGVYECECEGENGGSEMNDKHKDKNIPTIFLYMKNLFAN